MASMDHIDESSLQVILQILQDDVRDQLAQRLTANKDVGPTARDSIIATSLTTSELSKNLNMKKDQRLARSISNAVLTDDNAILKMKREDDLASQDHRLAQSLEEVDDPQQEAVILNTHARNLASQRFGQRLDQVAADAIDPRSLSQLAGMYHSEAAAVSLYNKAVSAGAVGGDTGNGTRRMYAAERVECTSCLTSRPFYETTRLTCGHLYCKVCVRQLFDIAAKDESFFPPRCCQQQIDIKTVEIFLTREIRDSIEQKREEYSTANRTYCSNLSCGAFISPTLIHNNAATCGRCQAVTCLACKANLHFGPCREDLAMEETLQLSEQNGWKRCGNCRNMVELNTGCYHMTCRCKYEFCYICGNRWKSCECPHWDEARLLQRAEELVNREDWNHNNEQERYQHIQDNVNLLVQNHECDHQNWKGLRGARTCESCTERLPYFVYECRQCRIVACRQCRYNRL